MAKIIFPWASLLRSYGSFSWSPGQDACSRHMSGKVLRKAFWVGLDDPRHKLQSYKMIQMQSMASTTRCTKGGYGLDSRWTSGSGADCKESKTLTSGSGCRWLQTLFCSSSVKPGRPCDCSSDRSGRGWNVEGTTLVSLALLHVPHGGATWTKQTG